MSGGYTHITLAQLAAQKAVYNYPDMLHDDALQALFLWKRYLVVGSLGPDYPYLDITNPDSIDWANCLHRYLGLDFLRRGIREVRAIRETNIRQKCLAWLFGFASHAVTDATIHPVINLKFGPYEKNQAAHRHCEMSQDVLIHPRLNLGPISVNRQLSLYVQESSFPGHPELLDKDIADLWTKVLLSVYGADCSAPATSVLTEEAGGDLPLPTPNAWHRAMGRLMRLAERGDRPVPFVRHVAAGQGLIYPHYPEEEYVKQLEIPVPEGAVMDFEEIFERALHKVISFWGDMSPALQTRPSRLDTMSGWSLDTGRNRDGRLIFWED